MGIPTTVLELAARQGGYVRRDQLIDHGLSPSAIDRRIRTGVLSPASEGVYRVIPSDDHIDLMRGALLALPDAVVSHQSAAHLLRFPTLPKLVPTVVVASHTTHRFAGVKVRRCNDLLPSDIVQVDGMSVTGIYRTTFDLAAVIDFRLFDRIIESLVMADRLHLDRLRDLCLRLSRRGKPEPGR